MIAYAQDLPDKGAKIEIVGIKAEVSSTDNWETIGMIIVLVLAIYLGVKVINRLFEKDKKKTGLF